MWTLSIFFIVLNVVTVLTADMSAENAEPRMIPQNYPMRCGRSPTGGSISKASGDNDFSIKISGNPTKYQPNEHYTVTLQGKDKKKFVGFMLMVLPKDIKNDISARPDVGAFQLLGDVVSKYSEECPNTIVNASKISKNVIEVMWRAPPADTGCVVFRAAVQENRDMWYMDEGRLIQVLCEEEQENQDEQPEIIDECCACDEAKYELAFEGMWTRHTHPKDYPAYEWGTSFTDIIGVSHTNDFRMWEYGKKASDGVKEIAKTGDTRRMETEFKAESNNIRTIIKTRGLRYPNIRTKTFAVFRVDKYHHLMSLLTRMQPSPDWIVGISAMELCLKNCSWIREKVLNMYPWDAGVDNGLTYTSEKSMTYPQGEIRRITSSTPNNPLSPFYDQLGTPLKPVAQLIITRQRVYDKKCKDYDVPTTANPYSNDGMDDRKECRVSDWTDFQPCSVTCGQGFRIRSRRYFNKQKAEMAGCKIQLVDSEMCMHTCVGNVSCRTTEWGEWSECSVTCGKGLRMRSRKFIDSHAKKQCAIDLMQKETCKGLTPVCDDDDDEEDPQCAMTHWSEWSPCTVTCGKGVTVRMRLYLNPESLKFCNKELSQKSECTADNQDCKIPPHEAKKICMKPKEVGPCRGYFPRWHYDVNRKMCVQFIYGGCRGNRNNFERYNDCRRMCENLNTVQEINPISFPAPSNSPIETTVPPQIVDCLVSEWGEWSPCSPTCGNGKKERSRTKLRDPENGGQPCPTKLIQRRKCKNNPPCTEATPTNEEEYGGDGCLHYPWSEWTPCTRTCGQGEIQTRTKSVQAYPRFNTPSCKPKVERKYCALSPCPPF